MSSVPVKQPVDSSGPKNVAERFRRLAEVWHQETDHLSSMSEASAHPAYQEIIDLGPDILPLLFRDLEENHTHWFGALAALTGAQPIPTGAGGKIPTMVDAWIRWAKDNGYRW